MDITERAFESAIEADLLGRSDAGGRVIADAREPYGAYAPGGYRRRTSDDYDRTLCLDRRVLLDFVVATQPKEWQRLKKQYGQGAADAFCRRVASEVGTRGVVDVLRKGVKDRGCRFRLAYFKPNTTLNPDTQRLYRANQFSVVRQLHYSTRNENSLDMVLFLNGLPLFTVELKNELTGQTVRDAMRQYRRDRDPREPLLSPGRCVAHFAVDPHEVYFTTCLDGAATRFFPFNKGFAHGRGNPPKADGYETDYLWREVWARDSVLNLIERFVYLAGRQDPRRRRKRGPYIFPRYHQLDAVRRLVTDSRASGSGRRYLVQHSAGSGKTYTISWLAHQLALLHDAADRRVFDSVIVVTDRRVLDAQMRDEVRHFEQTPGMVEAIEGTSRDLKEALEKGRQIIVTTLQKFPVIWRQVGELPGNTFAVIIDEAHSSQGGSSSRKMQAVLASGSLEEAADEEDPDATTAEQMINEELARTGPQPNVSLYAFTATPRPETLQVFGQKDEEGEYRPFSLYSMRQAIEEGFILDVLENYTTYKSYWRLVKAAEDDPRVQRNLTTRLLRRYVSLHPHTIETKAEIMVEHFHQNVAHRIDGRAKAMIVTSSRLHAVRYRQALDAYLAKQGYSYGALVAFSGRVRDPDRDAEYTESGMNRDDEGRPIPESRTAKEFEKPYYRFLVVANKFQTGFDQPFLHTMYVDKRLSGLNAVQTLSRLNRVAEHKTETMVLDFVNEADAIREAFQPYYQATLLEGETDPNLLYELERELGEASLHSPSDVRKVSDLLYTRKVPQRRLYSALRPVLDRYNDADEETQASYRGRLQQYVRLYSFLSQILTFHDGDLLRLYHFCRVVLRNLPDREGPLPPDVERKVRLEQYNLKETFSGRVDLKGQNAEVAAPGLGSEPRPPEDEQDLLSRIVEELNTQHGLNLNSQTGSTYLREFLERMLSSEPLRDSVRVNPPDTARLTFEHLADDYVQDTIDFNLQMYKALNDHPDFRENVFERMWDVILRRLRAGVGEA